jgi:hypothetical protein
MKSMKTIFASCLLFANCTILFSNDDAAKKAIIMEERMKNIENQYKNIENQFKTIKPTASSMRTAMGSAMRTAKVTVGAIAAYAYLNKVVTETQDLTKFPDFSTQDMRNYGNSLITTLTNSYKSMGFNKTNHHDNLHVITKDEATAQIKEITEELTDSEILSNPAKYPVQYVAALEREVNKKVTDLQKLIEPTDFVTEKETKQTNIDKEQRD